MDRSLLKHHLITVLVTSAIIIIGFIMSMNIFLPVWCEDRSCIQALPIKSPIVMMQMGSHLLLTDVRDVELNAGLEGLVNSEIVELLQNILHPGDRVLEVGAGIGQYSLIIGDAIGADGDLFIFEPNSDALLLLKANLKINDLWDESSITNKMPYSSSSTLILEKFMGSLQHYRVLLKKEDVSANTRDVVNIASIKLDTALGAERFNFIKLNCYGAEIHVLSGAEKILQNSPKISILMPWNPEEMKYYGDIQPFINNMVYLGFEFWNIPNHGTKELITKSRLLRENFDNMLITRRII